MFKINPTRCALTCAALLITAPVAAEDGSGPLFAGHETLSVEIEGPFAALSEDRPEEEELPGILRYTADDGSVIELDVALRTRGKLRRDEEVCEFPPLRLNFKKSQVEGTVFESQDKLKLVSHCQNFGRLYEQGVVAEYIAYRILNLLTDHSYRARLLSVAYTYSDSRLRFEKYAILIEHKDSLGERLGAETTVAHGIPVTDIYPAGLNLVSVFQYLIGNTDFSPIASDPDGGDCCHNQTLLVREGQFHLTVPYDFDLSGLVNAEYAEPNPRFKLRSPRQRLYRGRCINNNYLPATLALFRERRAAIEALVRDQAELDDGYRKRMLGFIEDFYKTIDNPKRVRSKLIKQCLP